MLFLLSPIKSAFPVAYKFIEVRKVGPIIPSGIGYFVRSADVFEANQEVVEYFMGYVDFKRAGFHLYPQREE